MNIKTMDNNQLFKAVVESQNALKNELLVQIKKIDTKVDAVATDVKVLRSEVNKGFKDASHRIDLLGKELFELNEDAPVGEEFAKLVKRVDKLEKYQTFVTA